MNQLAVLRGIAKAMECFSGAPTSRQLPKRDVLREVKAGTVESIGLAVMCDGDGFQLYPERHRECYALTPLGRSIIESLESSDVER